MKLLHTVDLTLHEFIGEKVPKYAILSHTWEGEEVNYTDLQRDPYFLTREVSGPKEQSKSKIKSFCATANQEYGIRYGWVDTCCIDKSSSADLSECINSMFRWYERSTRCIALLSDVYWLNQNEENSELNEKSFAASRWFTRAWTLQELIAPENVTFYDAGWTKIGTKELHADVIHKACSIPHSVLCGQKSIYDYSVAQRMSWASKRESTRPEDIAYCLLGVFDINMPLLYGEGGEKAFLRLQEEIIRESTDESIFAWDPDNTEHISMRGIFAKHPKEFKSAYDIVSSVIIPRPRPYFSTHRGIQIDLVVRYAPPSRRYVSGDWIIASHACLRDVQLNCTREKKRITLTLFHIRHQEYARVGPLFTSEPDKKADKNPQTQQVYLRKKTREY